jgi:crotonobetainyl-CoA:carnitine CoA-transferase CaiB-like acyl-CoA transferase
MAHPSVLELTRLAGLLDSAAETVEIAGDDPVFNTRYRVAIPGAAAIAATGIAAADLWALKTGRRQEVRVNARAVAAALRSTRYLRINGQQPPPFRDPYTGFYRLKDGRWMYLHCNFPNLRDQNLRVIGAGADKASVTSGVGKWDGLELEDAIFAGGGCCGFVRSEEEWNSLAQSAAAASTPLLEILRIGDAPPEPLPAGDRPLSGVRLLDLTRVLAGPACAKCFAEHGADVMKVSREGMSDSGMLDIDTGLGKLSAYLDLRDPGQMETLRSLIRGGDVFSQAYRPNSLAARGLSPEALAAMRPGIVYITLSAWGHVGPWRNRRGYDTVVQSANGMAYRPKGELPVFTPVAAQDYVAGYLMAYGGMVALGRRAREGGSWMVRISLAGTGHWIRKHGLLEPSVYGNAPDELPADELQALMTESDSPLGRLSHLAPVVQMSKTPARIVRPAVPLGSSPPVWPQRG